MSRTATRDLTFTALFAALMAAGAFVVVPVGPVPFTLQVLFALLAGLLLGPRLGVLSVLVYLAMGLVAPVYAGGSSGVGVLFGPTGGYLWGFTLGALVAGVVVQGHHETSVRCIAAALLGLVPVYFVGAVWLGWQLDGASWRVVIATGITPFVPADIAKAVLAGLLARSLVSLPLGLPVPERDR